MTLRSYITALLAALALATIPAAVAWATVPDQEGTPDETAATQGVSTESQWVRSYLKKPKRRIKARRHFTPEATPNKREVLEIMRHEQRRWGGPSLHNRIACESEFRWNATNGQYRGLLQIGSWWSYAYSATPRRVKIKTRKWVRRPVWRVKVYSDGHRERRRVRRKRVRKIVVKVGKLPRNASPYHGWAAIRVGQRAVSGDGPSTSWSCGL